MIEHDDVCCENICHFFGISRTWTLFSSIVTLNTERNTHVPIHLFVLLSASFAVWDILHQVNVCSSVEHASLRFLLHAICSELFFLRRMGCVLCWFDFLFVLHVFCSVFIEATSVNLVWLSQSVGINRFCVVSRQEIEYRTDGTRPPWEPFTANRWCSSSQFVEHFVSSAG